MSVDRRRFIGLSVGFVAAGALPGCASVATTHLTPSAGALRLRPSDYPQLAGAGGYLRVQPSGHPSAIYLLHDGEGSYVALSPICTHLGCTVNVEGTHLVCPCHGSTYDRGGRVVRGPAERALPSYRVEPGGPGEIVIHIEEAAA